MLLLSVLLVLLLPFICGGFVAIRVTGVIVVVVVVVVVVGVVVVVVVNFCFRCCR